MDNASVRDKSIWHPFTPLLGTAEFPLITRGEGVYLVTSDGRKILDAISSWWVNLHGHANAHIAQAIAGQALKLEQVIFAGFTHEPAITLAENLLRILPPGHKKIFYSDNGSTAVEVALKMAIQYWHNSGVIRRKVIAIKGAYHGDTFGSMSVADRGLFNKPFFPFLFDTEYIVFPAHGKENEVLDQFHSIASKGDVAAFIFEPLIQAAAGMRMYSPSVLDQLLACAQKHGIVSIADEVFTGFGRTGKHFATGYLKNQPDIIAVSKGITGGFMPLGVTACSQKIVEAFESASFNKTFFHGHSYTANPLACAAANASFELLTAPECQRRIHTINEMHSVFADSVRSNKNVEDVRVLGTILAIELATDEGTNYENSIRTKIYPYFLERNILLRPLGNVIYILPPYVISENELRSVYRSIEEFLRII